MLTLPEAAPAADLRLDPTDLVCALEIDGAARVYPTEMLRTYHVVNDRLGATPVAVAFCPRCYSGVALDPVVDDRVLSFRVFGLYQGTLALIDDQTRTIWTPFTAEAIAGPLAGRRLAVLPLTMATFGAWLAAHPDSTTPRLAIGGEPQAGRRRPGEPSNDGILPKLVGRWDERLPARALILGVDIDGTARAYVMEPRRPPALAVGDELAGVPIVLMGASGEWPLAYDRRLDGQQLEFRVEADEVLDQSGSSWKEGRAVSGSLAGSGLRFVPSHVSEWYTWAAFHPDSEIRRLT